VIADYAADDADVIVTDAGRGYAAKLGKALSGHGFLPMAATAGDASRLGPVATLRYQRQRCAA
jgi:hypothetical protein